MTPHPYHSSSTLQLLRLASAGVLAVAAAGCGGSGSSVGPPDQGLQPVDSLVLSLDSAEVIMGDTLRLIAIATDAGGLPVAGVTLVWSSTDQSVATVSSDGLVTAVAEGQAEIAVDVAGGSQTVASSLNAGINFAASEAARGRSRAKIIVVHQSACGGAFAVKTWDAMFEVSYAAAGSRLDERYSVNQGSSATAALSALPSDGTKADWIGAVKGGGRIDNLLSHPDNRAPGGVYKVTEKAAGPLETITPTTVHLQILKDPDGTCRFTVTYEERTTWTVMRTYLGSESLTGFFGAATISGLLGQKPRGGWVIGSTKTLTVASQNSELPTLPGSSFYTPASTVAVALMDAVGESNAGAATVTFALTAR